MSYPKKNGKVALVALAIFSIIIIIVVLASNQDTVCYSNTTPTLPESTTSAPTEPQLNHTEHNYTVSVIQQPTCETNGMEEGLCECGAGYHQLIDALGHDLQVERREPECVQAGYIRTTCSRCSYNTEESLFATGHEWGEWQVRTPSSCGKAGEEYCVCQTCGTEDTRITEALSHEYGHPHVVRSNSCEDDGLTQSKCAKCGDIKDTVIPALQHNYSKWLIKTKPTCTKAGEETRTCAHCLKTEHRSIKELSHEYVYISTQTPTTTADGFELYNCTRCGIERRISLPMLKAVDVDKCGESLLGKVLPNAPYPEFTEKMFDRWARELTQQESHAEGLIRFPGVVQNSWTPIREWEVPYRYITNPFPYTAYKYDDYSEFYCWASEKEYANQRAVYQRVEEILKELGIDKNTTQKEAIIRINQWVCDYKYYQSSDERDHDDTYFSLFRQDGVCHNYTLAFQVLCLGAGIECHYYSSTEMNHAWNKVYFSDGSYLWVDCTWNDSTRPNRYLLISTKQLLKDHAL